MMGSAKTSLAFLWLCSLICAELSKNWRKRKRFSLQFFSNVPTFSKCVNSTEESSYFSAIICMPYWYCSVIDLWKTWSCCLETWNNAISTATSPGNPISCLSLCAASRKGLSVSALEQCCLQALILLVFVCSCWGRGLPDSWKVSVWWASPPPGAAAVCIMALTYHRVLLVLSQKNLWFIGRYSCSHRMHEYTVKMRNGVAEPEQ